MLSNEVDVETTSGLRLDARLLWPRSALGTGDHDLNARPGAGRPDQGSLTGLSWMCRGGCHRFLAPGAGLGTRCREAPASVLRWNTWWPL